MTLSVKPDSLAVIPLGGVMEIGKNMTCYAYNDSMIIVDCGLKFPSEEMPGVDIVIPDIAFLEENKDKLLGVFLTHGHEDHIGALPYFLRKINVPVYGTRLTLGFVSNKLEEHRLLGNAALYEVAAGDVLEAGDFEIEYFQVAHSIPDTCGVVIRTPAGTVVQSADFKFDAHAVNGYNVDLTRLAEIGKENVAAFLCDTTNAEKPGHTGSEKEVGESLDKIIGEAGSRVILAAFASNIHRVQQVVDIAEKYGRRVAIVGRSMIENCRIAQILGYLAIPEGVQIDPADLDAIPPEKTVIITTGSQGEPLSALTQMAAEEHRYVDIIPGDTVIISATPIPGNEAAIINTINRLFALGADVIYPPIHTVHVSGHANREDIRMMLSLLKPRYLVPVHGEPRHFHHFRDLAEGMGWKEEEIFGLSAGDVLEINETGASVTGRVPSGSVLVDGLGVGDVEDVVLRDRFHLSTDGVIIAVLNVDIKNRRLTQPPEIFSRGVAGEDIAESLLEPLPEKIDERLQVVFTDNGSNPEAIKSAVKRVVSRHVYDKTHRHPLIIPIVTEF
ncbi:MAG: ribonuclease J [Abditibacteriota bacterium]|nr:ribonuclease J [Abditibacteriota bacterium]